MAARRYGQQSAVVRALELVGERWALLIVRDLLVGPRRYTDLKQNLPRIPTNILSDRLKELQHADVIRRLPLAHGLAYALTEHGRDLEPVILGLARWGLRSLGEPAHGDLPTPDSLTVDLLAAGDIHAHGARGGPGAARALQRNLRGGPGATGVGVAVGRGVGIRSDRVDDDSVTDADGRTGDRA